MAQTFDQNDRLYVSLDHPSRLHFHANGAQQLSGTQVAAAPGAGLEVIITNVILAAGAFSYVSAYLHVGATTGWGPIYLNPPFGRIFASGPIHVPGGENNAVLITSSANTELTVDIDYIIQPV
jgi:hypothetical protein